MRTTAATHVFVLVTAVAAPLSSCVLLAACDTAGEGEGEGDIGEGEGEGDAGEGEGELAVDVRLFDVALGAADPRFDGVPARLSIVEWVPATLIASAPGAASVRFVVDGEERLDDAAPFLFTEGDAGAAAPWTVALGSHTIAVQAFTSSDGSGAPLAEVELALELVADGIDDTPEQGEHSVHQLWITDAGQYVQRAGNGDFVDVDGNVVLAAGEVTSEDRGADQVYLVSPQGRPQLAFAFEVLLPEGFSPDVAYPMLVLLHHGAELYRGTDLDPALLEQPPLTGARSLVSSSIRNEFPAIVLVPQLQFHDAIDGVNHEWAAFLSIDGDTGSADSAPEPSLGAAFVLGIIDDLAAGLLRVDGVAPRIDAHRLYLTGHSMGGLGSWDLVERLPELWAAVAPMAGFPDHARAAAVVDVPIWAFHHQIDCYNTFAGTSTMVQLIEEAGGTRVVFSALDFDTGGACDQAHFQTPDHAFADEALLPWMFSQVR